MPWVGPMVGRSSASWGKVLVFDALEPAKAQVAARWLFQHGSCLSGDGARRDRNEGRVDPSFITTPVSRPLQILFSFFSFLSSLPESSKFPPLRLFFSVFGLTLSWPPFNLSVVALHLPFFQSLFNSLFPNRLCLPSTVVGILVCSLPFRSVFCSTSLCVLSAAK